MARGLWLNARVPASAGPWAWTLMCGAIAAGALLTGAVPGVIEAGALPEAPWAWQRDAVWVQPWTLWTAAWLHLDGWHLMGTVLAAALVAALGWLARVPPAAAIAWWAAWPMTHAVLWLDPRLSAYAGASALLHAGVAVAALVWLWPTPGTGGNRRRPDERTFSAWWPATLLAGLLLKLALEAPWELAVRWQDGWPVAVSAHAAGVGTGLLLGAVTILMARRVQATTR